MCEACNREVLVELGRQVDNCEKHGDTWCSCKVRQYINLLGLEEHHDAGDEVRYMTDWFMKNEKNHESNEENL